MYRAIIRLKEIEGLGSRGPIDAHQRRLNSFSHFDANEQSLVLLRIAVVT